VTFETGNVVVDERSNITSSDGINRIVKLTSSRIRDASDNVTQVVEIIRDITEQKQAELEGYNRNELLTMRIKDIEAIETDEIIQQRMHKIVTVGWDRFETRHKCKDGRIVDIEASVNYMGVVNITFFGIHFKKQGEMHIRII